jgi:hypothetical protein
LEQASHDKDPLVREHALWGIQQIRNRVKTERAKI